MPLFEPRCLKIAVAEAEARWPVGSYVPDLENGEIGLFNTRCKIPDVCPFSADVVVIVENHKVDRVDVAKKGSCTLE